MQVKTIKRAVYSKMKEWTATIEDVVLAEDVMNNIVVSGGCIASMFQGLDVNDYDVYIQDKAVLKRLCFYYIQKACKTDPSINKVHVVSFEDRFNYLSQKDKSFAELMENGESDEDYSGNLQIREVLLVDKNRIKIIGVSNGAKVDYKDKEVSPYSPMFFSPNAISLSDKLQIVVRFHGTPEQIHETFDFVHATNYWTIKDGLVLNIEALESILTKRLKYKGSLYPITSVIRMKKFIKRNFTISAGDILKMAMQISELDLSKIDVLEDQLIGVDVAYFSTLVKKIINSGEKTITSPMVNRLLDKIEEYFGGENEQDS